MTTTLRSVGIDKIHIQIITNLYCNPRTQVKVEEHLTNHAKIIRRERQRYVISTSILIFSIYVYSEEISAEALANLKVGIVINGEYINNHRYADDTMLLATMRGNGEI